MFPLHMAGLLPGSAPAVQKAGGDRMTNVELLFMILAIASLLLTIYFGLRNR